jgi:hypothetical protein
MMPSAGSGERKSESVADGSPGLIDEGPPMGIQP